MHPSQQGQQGSSRFHSSNVNSNPLPYHQPNNYNYNYNNTLGARAAYALTSALADPYGQTRAAYYSYANQNYVQAYHNQMQMQMQQRQRTTEEGYTLSSTYDPTVESALPSTSFSSGSRHNQISRSSNRGQTSSYHSPTRRHSDYPSRQQAQQQHPSHAPYRRQPAPGDIKCTYPGCSFSGSRQTVEIHRMDRHLIYPPGWKNKTNDWDADPSLKGKPIPILGTGLVLNTQESIDAWLAERKKRWPSKQNIEEKKKREHEAEQRGEINPSDLSRPIAKGTKKRRLGNNEERNQQHQQRSYHRPSPATHKRAKLTADNENRPRGLDNGPNEVIPKAGTEVTPSSATSGSDNSTNPAIDTHVISLPPGRKLETISQSLLPSDSKKHNDDDDEDDHQSSSDIDPVRDAISSKKPDDIPEDHPAVPSVEEGDKTEPSTLQKHQLSAPQPTQSERVLKNNKGFPQPKGPSRKPFASKSSLLRNLLLPEIKHTVSNLSQAIHFLAENDFLVGVELKPGDADAQPIQVLESDGLSAP